MRLLCQPQSKQALQNSCELLRQIVMELGGTVCMIVKLRSRSRSGEGQVRVKKVRRVRFGPELYTIFGFHHPPTLNQELFWALKGPRHVTLIWEGLV